MHSAERSRDMRTLVLFICLWSAAWAQVELPGYNVDPNSWSVSGISSGACMATQLHVAYASSIMGAGMVAGTPYYCGESSSLVSLSCMDDGTSDLNGLVARAESYASSGANDPTSAMNGDKVFIFHGTADSVVTPVNGPDVRTFYNNFGVDVGVQFNVDAEHGFPTSNFGGPCNQLDDMYINNCGYDGAFEILNHIYGGLQRPNAGTPTPGSFFEFDQRDFFSFTSPGYWSVDNSGWVYVPSACVGGASCRLHMALHGCSQGSEVVGTTFCTQTGYREVGELNNIIILFPQAVESSLAPVNPMGCWDWWGYNTSLYATKDGGQPLALYRMLRQASGLPW